MDIGWYLARAGIWWGHCHPQGLDHAGGVRTESGRGVRHRRLFRNGSNGNAPYGVFYMLGKLDADQPHYNGTRPVRFSTRSIAWHYRARSNHRSCFTYTRDAAAGFAYERKETSASLNQIR